MSLITAEDLKVEISQAQSPDDEDLINRIVEGVWGYWCELTDREWEWEQRSEYHSPEPGASRLYLYETPVTKIVGLYEDPWNWNYGPETLVDPSTYTFDDIRGILHRPWLPFIGGPRSIKVVYEAGYKTDNFPKGIKQVLIRQAALWFKESKLFGPRHELLAKIESMLVEFGNLVQQHKRHHV